MDWQSLVLANTFLAAISWLFYRAIAKRRKYKDSALQINAGFYLAQYLIVICLLPFLGNISFGDTWHYKYFLLAGGLGFALYNISIYKLLTYLDAGIGSVLGTLNVLFVVSFAFLILHETLNGFQILGAIMLIASICYILVVAKKPGRHRLHSKAWFHGLGFALLGGFFYGLAVVNERYLIGHMNLNTYLVFGWGAQMLASQLVGLTGGRRRYGEVMKSEISILMLSGGVLRGIAGYLYLLALIKSGNVSLVSIVANFRLIIIIVFGAWLMNEHDKLAEKFVTALVSIVGLSLMFWH